MSLGDNNNDGDELQSMVEITTLLPLNVLDGTETSTTTVPNQTTHGELSVSGGYPCENTATASSPPWHVFETPKDAVPMINHQTTPEEFGEIYKAVRATAWKTICKGGVGDWQHISRFISTFYKRYRQYFKRAIQIIRGRTQNRRASWRHWFTNTDLSREFQIREMEPNQWYFCSINESNTAVAVGMGQ
jgi:hypothetical protein